MQRLAFRRNLLVAAALLAGSSAAAEPGTAAAPATAATAPATLEVTADDFRCMQDMTPVRGFFVDNLMGDLPATVAVAESTDGGVYPPGSVVQLVPTEVMVKHHEGFSPATNDWEFFEIDVTPDGTAVRARGFANVVNRFGGNCFGCHVKAEPKWDMICETGHGCDPIPLTAQVVRVLQKADPRCDAMDELTPEETQILQAIMAAGAPG